MKQPSGLPAPPSLCIQHGLESRALPANIPSQHKQQGGYVLWLVHQPILSCAIRPALASLWTHSCGIKVNTTSYSTPFISSLLPSPPSLHCSILHLTLHLAPWANLFLWKALLCWKQTQSETKTSSRTGLIFKTNLYSLINSIHRGQL